MTVKKFSRLLIFYVYLKQSPIQQKPGTFQEVKTAFLGCLSITTGHGLPQIVKPGNLFLNVLWVTFYALAVGGCGLLVYQAVDQYCQFDVITMTKIKRDVEMTLPAVTFCSKFENNYDMIIDCAHGTSHNGCKIRNLTLYDREGNLSYCVQLNYGTNRTELQKVTGMGWKYGYRLTMYQPWQPDNNFYVAFTDNSARVVHEEAIEYVFAGQETEIVLSKTVQTSLGSSYSKCNESTEYRQVTCNEDCYNEAMTKACGCGFPAECAISRYRNQKCLDAYSNRNDFLLKCNQECPVECNQVSFPLNRVDVGWDLIKGTVYFESKIYNSLTYYKAKVSKKFNISNMSDDEIKECLTRIYIYFNKLETTEITQSPSITTTSLIANVGGLLGKLDHSLCIFKIHLTYPITLIRIGLFLGFSLLSSIEAVDLLIRIGFILSRTVKTTHRP
jgi:hypothetical protein